MKLARRGLARFRSAETEAVAEESLPRLLASLGFCWVSGTTRLRDSYYSKLPV